MAILIDKLFRGVLAIETDCGRRYVQPSLGERLRLLWTFRNFRLLPEEVLTRSERTLISSLYRKGNFLANGNGRGDLSLHAIGIVELAAARQQPQATVFKPSARVQPTRGALPRAG